MANNLSDFLENALIKHLFKTAAYPQPTHLYFALSTANPGESGGTIAEPAGFAYARVQADAVWTIVGSVATSNADVTFPTASGGNWGTITHFAVFDASVGGNMLWYGPLQTPQVVNSGGTFYFPSGDLAFSFD